MVEPFSTSILVSWLVDRQSVHITGGFLHNTRPFSTPKRNPNYNTSPRPPAGNASFERLKLKKLAVEILKIQSLCAAIYVYGKIIQVKGDPHEPG